MQRSRRVVFFAAYPHVYGGAERILELLAVGLQLRGWAPEVVLPAAGVVAERLSHAGVRVDVVGAPASLGIYGKATTGRRSAAAAAALPAYWSRLRRRFRGASVAHVFGHRGIVVAGPAARLARVPLVWQVGGTEPSRAINVVGSAAANATVAVSASAAAALPGWARPAVVPNAVDPDAFTPRRLDDSRVHVACAARLTPEKGVDVLLRAAALLHATAPDLRVLVLGGPQAGHEAYWGELLRLAGELGVSRVVEFAGFVERPYERWAEARVYVQPSREEGFGLAAAEAMAGGLPVVASDVGGLGDLLDHGDAGILVPPDDPGALADAVRRLLDDEALAARLGEAGRERVASAFSVDRMLDGVEAVYRRLGAER